MFETLQSVNVVLSGGIECQGPCILGQECIQKDKTEAIQGYDGQEKSTN